MIPEDAQELETMQSEVSVKASARGLKESMVNFEAMPLSSRPSRRHTTRTLMSEQSPRLSDGSNLRHERKNSEATVHHKIESDLADLKAIAEFGSRLELKHETAKHLHESRKPLAVVPKLDIASVLEDHQLS